jgi:2-desacetyl-2-hydroxyethyl bacteriochlorophyllide A dehydrogenase
MKTASLLVTAPNIIEVGEIDVPGPVASEVLVEVELTGVSPGTELRCLRGEQPGQPSFPFIPGYNGIGRVAQVGEGVTLPVGTRVLSAGTSHADVNRCWGGHCAHHVRPESGVIPLPEEISDNDTLLVQLASIAHRGVRLARPRPGEKVLIVGLGPIGQCSARLFGATGAQVFVLDRVPERVALLQAQGIDGQVVTDNMEEAGKAIFPDGADIIVDASGAAPVALQAAKLLHTVPWDNNDHPTPRYVVQGSYPQNVAFNYQDLFGSETTVFFPRGYKRSDAETVISLLQRGKIALGDICNEIVSPDHAASIYARLQEGRLLTAGFNWRNTA